MTQSKSHPRGRIYPGRRNWRHIKVFDWVLAVPELSHAACQVYGVLVSAAGNTGVARRWSHRRIGDYLWRSEDWVRRAIHELVSAGLIEVIPPAAGERASRYHFLDHPLMPGSYGNSADERGRRDMEIDALTDLWMSFEADSAAAPVQVTRHDIFVRLERAVVDYGIPVELLRYLIEAFFASPAAHANGASRYAAFVTWDNAHRQASISRLRDEDPAMYVRVIGAHREWCTAKRLRERRR